jgi:hypothetical protein
VDKAFRALLACLEALAVVRGQADHEAFIYELNAILERYKNLLAQQKGKRMANSERLVQPPQI